MNISIKSANFLFLILRKIPLILVSKKMNTASNNNSSAISVRVYEKKTNVSKVSSLFTQNEYVIGHSM